MDLPWFASISEKYLLNMTEQNVFYKLWAACCIYLGNSEIQLISEFLWYISYHHFHSIILKIFPMHGLIKRLKQFSENLKNVEQILEQRPSLRWLHYLLSEANFPTLKGDLNRNNLQYCKRHCLICRMDSSIFITSNIFLLKRDTTECIPGHYSGSCHHLKVNICIPLLGVLYYPCRQSSSILCKLHDRWTSCQKIVALYLRTFGAEKSKLHLQLQKFKSLTFLVFFSHFAGVSYSKVWKMVQGNSQALWFAWPKLAVGIHFWWQCHKFIRAKWIYVRRRHHQQLLYDS